MAWLWITLIITYLAVGFYFTMPDIPLWQRVLLRIFWLPVVIGIMILFFVSGGPKIMGGG